MNTTWPELKLSKKHHSIAYQHAQEPVVAGTGIISNEHTLTNLVDLFTKTMTAPKRKGLLDKFTY